MASNCLKSEDWFCKRCCGHLLCGSVLMLPLQIGAADEHDYLEAIQRETQKVEPASLVRVHEPSGTLVTRVGTRKSGTGETTAGQIRTIGEFEQMLQRQYTGTAVFYRGLSARSRQEIFDQYLAGAGVPDLRGKIMDRYLNR